MRKNFFEDYAIPESEAEYFYNLFIKWNPSYEQFLLTARQTKFIKNSTEEQK